MTDAAPWPLELDRSDLQLPPGRLLPIVRWGAAIMHRPLTPVTTFDDQLARLAADMFVTMDAADGVGLAANQVGVDLAMFVFDVRGAGESDEAVGVVCNPVLTVPAVDDPDHPGQELIVDSEGCLSLPGAFVPCKRPLLASVAGVDHTGAAVTFSGSGLLARCLQHESDHLRGAVFADHVPSRLRRKLQRQAERFAPEFPDDWPVTPRQEVDD
jgi:peptide deformylase